MSQNSYNSKELDAIRKKIDTLDNKIHETLIERAELVLKIGEEKRKNNIEVVQPAREARMIRRLLQRHRGALPEMAVVRIWRELVGAVSLLQTGLKVTVAESEEDPVYWDLAKDYFGSCLPMTRADSVFSAIKAVQEGRVTFAVVPYPTGMVKETDALLWWECLSAGSDNALSVSVRLPHGDDPEMENPTHKALVISKSGFDSSDDDHSFIYIECDPSISRGRIAETAEEAGLKPVGLTSKPDGGDVRKHFLEVKGFVYDENEAIEQIKEALGTDKTAIFCVGGYPVPPTYKKTVRPQDDEFPTAPAEDEKE
ncbi:MAG: chorismate mutase [Pseudomonadota bacterium]